MRQRKIYVIFISEQVYVQLETGWSTCTLCNVIIVKMTLIWSTYFLFLHAKSDSHNDNEKIMREGICSYVFRWWSITCACMESCIEKKQRQWPEKKLANLPIMHIFRKRKLIYYYPTHNHNIFLKYDKHKPYNVYILFFHIKNNRS